MRRRTAIALVLLSVAGGCGSLPDDVDPLPRPSDEDLDDLRSTSHPVYWLGSSYEGHELSSARIVPRSRRYGPLPRTYLTYGEPDCDTSGCHYPLEVDTSAARDIVDPPRCWRDLGRALMLACFDDDVRVLTGSVIVYVRFGEESALRAAGSLRLTKHDTATAPLPEPTPFTCRELARIPDRYERHLPRRLRVGCSKSSGSE